MKNPGQRWEEGVEHRPESVKLFEFIKKADFEQNDDFFCFKSGGDGDNGETLMYLMDMYFESQADPAIAKAEAK